MKRVAVSWTGGKDSTLALHKVATSKNNDATIIALVSFQPELANFKSHPIPIQQVQAEALSLPFIQLKVRPEDHSNDYKLAYAACIKKLRDEHNIDVIVTGDIDVVSIYDGCCGEGNFITDCCKIANCGVECWLPLWKLSREDVWIDIFNLNFTVKMSCVKSPFFDPSWVGKIIDTKVLDEMRLIPNLDLCGENGEYHTCVVDAPLFQKRIELILLDDDDNTNTSTIWEETTQQMQPEGQHIWVLKQNMKPVLRDHENM